MSLLSSRRALVLAGLSGILLAGATLATSTAAHADDGATTTDTKKTTSADDSITDFPVTIADATDAAESKYPDCEATAALLYDTASTPVWDVELTCESGTVKYVSVNAEDGKVSATGGTGSSSSTGDDDDWWSTGDGDGTAKTDKSTGKDDEPKPSGKSADDGDAPGTGANTDYS